MAGHSQTGRLLRNATIRTQHKGILYLGSAR